MANLRLQGRVRVTEDDLQATYQRLVQQERSQLDFRAAQIVIGIPEGADSQLVAERRALANRLQQRANAGEEFSELARRYSDDAASKKVGGLLPLQKPIELPEGIARSVVSLELGRASRPIRYENSFVVLKLIERAPS